MGSFQYEWWTVDVIYTTGKMCTEFKAKSRDHAVKQINRWVEKTNKDFNNPELPWWKRGNGVKEVLWDTLTLDRVGYQREY